MSHFTVLVFGNENQVDDLLKPFDENIKVPEYETGKIGEDEKLRFSSYYTDEKGIHESLSFEQLYEKYGAEWNSNHWRKNADGVWCEYSTYNPKSEWDWYQTGGRWDNAIPNNYCLVKDLPEDFVPFAFVDQSGNWHERAKMGWWAATSNEKETDAWQEEFKNALKEYSGYVTLVDCHI